MFPTNQPLNIYNTMSRNPYDIEYKEPVFNHDLINEPKPIIETIPINEPKFTPLSNNNLEFENPLIPNNYITLKSQLDKSKVLDELKTAKDESKLKKNDDDIISGGTNEVRHQVLLDYKNFYFDPKIIDGFKKLLDDEINPDGTPLTKAQKGARLKNFKLDMVKRYNEKVQTK